MHAISNFLHLHHHSATHEHPRNHRFWWARIERAAGVLANMFCTVAFGMLLVWIVREMWLELMK